jgi:hypothetical protein
MKTGLTILAALALFDASAEEPRFVEVDGAMPRPAYTIPEPPAPVPKGAVDLAFDTSGNC